MKRSPVVLLVVLAVVLAGCFPQSPSFGRVSVESDPPGAKIFLDGRDTGRTTPATLDNVAAGAHQIRLELEGYQSVTRSVNVPRNQTVTVSVTLEPAEGPGGPEEPEPDGPVRVFGYVQASRGGRLVPEVTVKAVEADTGAVVASTVTDAGGAYTLFIPAGTYDIIAEKPGRAQAKRQALHVEDGDAVRVDLISMQIRDPAKEAKAPTIKVEYTENGITYLPFERGMVVPGGAVWLGRATVNAVHDMYRTQVWIGHRGDVPDWQGGISLNNRVSVDFYFTDLFDAPGETELIVAAYDWQNNWTEIRIPFTYDVGDGAVFLHPVDTVDLVAVTYGHDLGLYRARQAEVYDLLGIAGDPDLLELPNGNVIDTSRLDKDVTMYVGITWTDVFDAAGYEIQRAFSANGPWELIARVGSWYGTEYIDLSPDLAPGKRVYYRVRAVGPNDEKGPWSVPVWVTPLDRFTIHLVSPADHATNVPLQPTFRWTYSDVGADDYYFDIFVAGVTGEPSGEFGYYTWYAEALRNVSEVEYNFDSTGVELQPGRTYQWNVIEGAAYAHYRPNSIAISFPWTGPEDANGYAGALNGEFVFTTTLGD